MKRALAFALISLTVVCGYTQKNLQLLGHLTYAGNVTCSNLTGYADTSGKEYALVGTSQGLSIVDVTNPASPVEIFFVPGATGQSGFWREVREYKGYAYVTTEQSSGLQVVNLNYLPDSIQHHLITPAGVTTSHTIFIDEKGVAYVNGTNKDQVLLDLNANPWNPPVLGRFTRNYVHDCYARNDTMWLACVNDGIVRVVDVTNKTAADTLSNTLAVWATPQDFTHNCWLSDDGNYLFTTDEKPSSFLTCYDVSDLNNVTETDRTQVEPGSNTVIHNTYFINDYCVTSYYTYGVTIHDVARKNNLVEVGNYDTSPNFSGDGFHGAWGVWPYLPSGNIIASDIETGLWIFKPEYKRACYVEGTVTDSICNTLLNGVKVEIVQNSAEDFSNFLGKYSFGTPDSGTYTIRFSKNGYQTKEYKNVVLQNGLLTLINVQLLPVSTSKLVIKTTDAATGNPLPFIRVLIEDTAGNEYQEISTNANGEYSYCDFVQGSYNFYAGKWGRMTAKISEQVQALVDTITFSLQQGYYDDFIMDYGWTVNSTATSGKWERGVPLKTTFNSLVSNPGNDVAVDFGEAAFVTGNKGGQAGDDDVDDGSTTLRSPLFDLSVYNDPYLSYYRWFFNNGGQGSAPNDSLIVTLVNGTDSVVIDTVGANNLAQSQWLFRKVRVKDFVAPTANMRVYFRTTDYNPGHLVEAGVDMFLITDSVGLNVSVGSFAVQEQFLLYPNPFNSLLYVRVNIVDDAFYKLKLLNPLGQIVLETVLTEANSEVNTGNSLSKGIYFAHLQKNNVTVACKVIVKAE
ncbi:MAG: choice-of-anchor B family protein [Chitinophagales bacterium]|nr:choice-of-anchor B family protein [Chitinophagales bacterium]